MYVLPINKKRKRFSENVAFGDLILKKAFRSYNVKHKRDAMKNKLNHT